MKEKEKLITKILRLRLSQKGPIWNRRIPTLFGLFTLTVGLFLTILLSQKLKGIRLEAQPSYSPQEIKITNLSPSSFTVSWITGEETTGFVSFGETPSLGKTALDDRDKQRGEVGNYTTHFVTLLGLKPETLYYLQIGSGKKLFKETLKVKTPAKIESPPVSDPAYGRIFDQNGSPAEGAIVYLFLPNCTPLSTLVKPSGSWLIAKNLSLKEDLTGFCQYPKKGGEYKILIEGGNKGKAEITLLTGLDQPLFDITLGKNYTFKDLSLLNPLKTPRPTPTPLVKQKTGDLNNDGVINSQDVAILKSKFGTTGGEADLNNDGRVDQKDLEILLQRFKI